MPLPSKIPGIYTRVLSSSTTNSLSRSYMAFAYCTKSRMLARQRTYQFTSQTSKAPPTQPSPNRTKPIPLTATNPTKTMSHSSHSSSLSFSTITYPSPAAKQASTLAPPPAHKPSLSPIPAKSTTPQVSNCLQRVRRLGFRRPHRGVLRSHIFGVGAGLGLPPPVQRGKRRWGMVVNPPPVTQQA